MVSLVDIVPQRRTVELACGQIELRGLGLRQIADLLLRFPNLRNLITAGAPAFETEHLLILAADALGAIIAEAAGQPEAAESIADGMAIDEVAECLIVVRDLTMPHGVTPFLDRLNRLLGSDLGAPFGGAPAMNAPKPPNSSLPQDTSPAQ